MKRILFITVSPPGNNGGGGEVYTYELLRELSSSCLIDLVYFKYKESKTYEKFNDNITILIEQVIDNSFKIKAFLKKPFIFPLFLSRYSNKISSFLKNRLNQVTYDAIYFDHSQTFYYAKELNHPNKILMVHDVIAQNYLRKKSFFTSWVKTTERLLLSYGTTIFTLSKKDCKLIQDYYGLKSNYTTLFIPQNVLRTIPTKIENYFVMFGAWGRPENYRTLQWMIDAVLPKMSNVPRIKIIGGGKMPELLKQKINSYPNLEYIGFLDNPYPIIANAIAEIVPLKYGAGVKVKCVEALACGTPVIGTDVAFEGIPCFSGVEHLMLYIKNSDELISAMQNVNVSIDKRLHAKDVFCNNYNKKNIVEYINFGLNTFV